MKKVLIIILSMALMLTLSACGGGDGKTSDESSAPSKSGNVPSKETGADEIRYYGIGEAAKYEKYLSLIHI